MRHEYDVYFNLHKRLWSLRSCHDRKVDGRHSPFVVLQGVEFIVSEAGRQRVLRERKNNVHAYARGTLYARGGTTDLPWDAGQACGVFKRAFRMLTQGQAVRVTYNPHRGPTFVDQKGRTVYGASLVAMGVSYGTKVPMVIAVSPRYAPRGQIRTSEGNL